LRFLILESRPDTHYGDQINGYEFPRRYLRQFEEATPTTTLVAIIYEPSRGGGSKSYVGWTTISSKPYSVDNSKSGKGGLLFVRYDRPIEYFEHPVFRLQGGVALESWLNEFPKTAWGLKLQGRAVRPVSPSDATKILALGNNDIAARLTEYDPAEEPPAERGRRLLRVAERSSTFRLQVMNNFGRKCAVTGLTVITQKGKAVQRLLHAAHIKPVADGGSDLSSNGVSLTPTLHALFDEGMFTIVPGRNYPLELKVSPHLESGMTRSIAGANLLVENGRPLVVLPSGELSRAALAYHLAKVFKT